MSSSLLSPNLAVNSDRSLTSRKKKKKKIQGPAVGENLSDAFQQQQNASVQWKSNAQHQIYTSKLLQALSQVRQNNNSSSPQKSASRRVHEAADRVLAATAKGRSRWSQAMLVSRLKLKFMKKNNITKRQQSVMTAITTGNSSRPLKKSKVSILRLKSKSLPAFQRKTRILGRLVPGCRKQPLQVVLEEATDYIPALEMQELGSSAWNFANPRRRCEYIPPNMKNMRRILHVRMQYRRSRIELRSASATNENLGNNNIPFSLINSGHQG